jgi:hypothetical protein
MAYVVCAGCRRHVVVGAPCPFCGSDEVSPRSARRWVAARVLAVALAPTACSAVYGGPPESLREVGVDDTSPEDTSGFDLGTDDTATPLPWDSGAEAATDAADADAHDADADADGAG